MKKICFASLSLLLLLAACNNNKTATEGSGKDTTAVADAQKPSEAATAAMDKQKEELEKLNPVSLDELKAMLPEVFMGGNRTNIDANSNNGASLASGEYAINDSMQVVVNIFDCAGPGGAGIYTMQFQSLESSQQETAEEYTKATTINGNKGYEHCDKVSNDCTVTYFTANRYLVVLEGKGVGAPALRAAAGQLKVK
jgi:predicted small secreted protein